MDGAVGVEFRAPKAGAQPGRAMPRHLLHLDATAPATRIMLQPASEKLSEAFRTQARAASKVTETDTGTLDLIRRLARAFISNARARICNRLSLSRDHTSWIARRNVSINILRTYGRRSWLQIQATECST